MHNANGIVLNKLTELQLMMIFNNKKRKIVCDEKLRFREKWQKNYYLYDLWIVLCYVIITLIFIIII